MVGSCGCGMVNRSLGSGCLQCIVLPLPSFETLGMEYMGDLEFSSLSAMALHTNVKVVVSSVLLIEVDIGNLRLQLLYNGLIGSKPAARAWCDRSFWCRSRLTIDQSSIYPQSCIIITALLTSTAHLQLQEYPLPNIVNDNNQ